MDVLTRTYYQNHAKELAGWYDTCTGGIASHFGVSFSAGMRVLEIDCGSGRDLARLLEAGIEASGVEPCAAFRQHAEKTYPRLRGCIADDGLPALSTVEENSLDGVLCSAVLMHLPEEQVLGGTREGRIVLVRSSGLTDPDTGSSFTVKRYHSEKVVDEAGSWRQTRIILEPLNQAYEPIELTPGNREDFTVIGEFVGVIGPA